MSWIESIDWAEVQNTSFKRLLDMALCNQCDILVSSIKSCPYGLDVSTFLARENGSYLSRIACVQNISQVLTAFDKEIFFAVAELENEISECLFSLPEELIRLINQISGEQKNPVESLQRLLNFLRQVGDWKLGSLMNEKMDMQTYCYQVACKLAQENKVIFPVDGSLSELHSYIAAVSLQLSEGGVDEVDEVLAALSRDGIEVIREHWPIPISSWTVLATGMG